MFIVALGGDWKGLVIVCATIILVVLIRALRGKNFSLGR